MAKIISKKLLAPNIYEMEVEAKDASQKSDAGNFVKVKISEKSERIPLTVADFDKEKGTITLVIQAIGKSTKDIIALNPGDEILDFLAPLGNHTETEDSDIAVVIGGGVGVAPVFPLARKLKQEGKKVISIIGYRSKDHIFWLEKMKAFSDEVLVYTNDGSFGDKGFVTDGLNRILKNTKINSVYAIGPTIMMKAVSDITKPLGIRTVVSLNSLMVCGLGMCGACRVTVGGKVKFTCKDGPDFLAKDVDFNELMLRLTAYKEEEAQ